MVVQTLWERAVEQRRSGKEELHGEADGKDSGHHRGGTGIGWAIAEAFAAEDARLLIARRRSEVGERAATEPRERGAKAIFVQSDISVPEQARRLVQRALEHFDALDILVNNAGISTSFAPFLELTEDQLDVVVGTNLRGTFLLSQAAREMVKRGSGRLCRRW
jgi:gluconate 5-dehydrogenase